MGEWQNYTDVEPATGSSEPVVGWFWDFVRDLDGAERRDLLFWASGFRRLPHGGWASWSNACSFTSLVPLRIYLRRTLATSRLTYPGTQMVPCWNPSSAGPWTSQTSQSWNQHKEFDQCRHSVP